jgi:hypothetical protein
MRTLLRVAACWLLLYAPTLAGAQLRTAAPPPPPAPQKIQAAILLDVSGSMQGLIEQAKAQLWNMMNVMGRARCAQGTPQIEVALYEYGRRTNPQKDGFARRISPFTTDLDSLSKQLFGLTIDGSDEYCAHAILQAATGLAWDSSAASYKVIFIAGNEDFMQGRITYEEACAEAKKKGIIVNTIYCGPRNRGIDERWDLGNKCGGGSYTHINHNLKLEDEPTPYDSVLLTLNDQFNDTYLPYGPRGNRAYAQQAEVDQLNFGMSRKVAARRVAVKSQSKLYQNGDWDLVDAVERDSSFLSRVARSYLPDSLKGKSPQQLQALVRAKKAQRAHIQQEINSVQQKRDQFLVEERTPATGSAELTTLEIEIEKIIKQQVKRFGMVIE